MTSTAMVGPAGSSCPSHSWWLPYPTGIVLQGGVTPAALFRGGSRRAPHRQGCDASVHDPAAIEPSHASTRRRPRYHLARADTERGAADTGRLDAVPRIARAA